MKKVKRPCVHSVGYNPYEHDLLEVGMCLKDDIANIPFNYCPWCGKFISTIVDPPKEKKDE